MATKTSTPKPRQRTKSTPSPRPRARLEARIDADLDELITRAADVQGISKTAFVSDAARDAALKVIARSDVILMSAEVFDQMMEALDEPDDSPELEDLAKLPRRIRR